MHVWGWALTTINHVYTASLGLALTWSGVNVSCLHCISQAKAKHRPTKEASPDILANRPHINLTIILRHTYFTIWIFVSAWIIHHVSFGPNVLLWFNSNYLKSNNRIEYIQKSGKITRLSPVYPYSNNRYLSWTQSQRVIKPKYI